MECPLCKGRTVGRIGLRQYYCWNCCVEFAQRGDDWEVFAVDLEGGLVRLTEAGRTAAPR
ncbi:MAG: hypothetical protein IRY95_09445 [Clostridia bacterium]|nr:hypothetical protein [Clostridia bacterium]